jgi:hypothetical protein
MKKSRETSASCFLLQLSIASITFFSSVPSLGSLISAEDELGSGYSSFESITWSKKNVQKGDSVHKMKHQTEDIMN